MLLHKLLRCFVSVLTNLSPNGSGGHLASCSTSRCFVPTAKSGLYFWELGNLRLPAFCTGPRSVDQQHHILLVDADPSFTRVLRFKFTHAGFAVTVASDGYEAWELLQENSFDFLIMAQQMPRMNGAELCERIREEPRLADLPILMITVKLLEIDRDRLREKFDLIDILGKPFSPRQVVQILNTHLVEQAVAPASQTATIHLRTRSNQPQAVPKMHPPRITRKERRIPASGSVADHILQ